MINLALALLDRYLGVVSPGDRDIDSAVALLREALADSAADHPSLAARLSNLMSALLARYRRTGGRPGDMRLLPNPTARSTRQAGYDHINDPALCQLGASTRLGDT